MIEGKCGWIIGRAKGYVGPSLKLLGGGGGGGGGGAWPPLFLRLCPEASRVLDKREYLVIIRDNFC